MNPETPSVKSVKSVDFSPKVSVIVPVYKVEKYLPECIESVLAQTFPDFELLLVDDGSPDNSGKICDDYAARDSRIRVFHKENGGVSSARNLGLDNARGEWIVFIDSDDVVLEQYLEHLVVHIPCQAHTPLIVSGFFDLVPAKDKWKKGAEVRFDREDVSPFDSFRKKNIYLYGQSVGKLYRKTIIDKYTIRFDETLAMSEDFVFMADYLQRSDLVCLIEFSDYGYRYVSGSLSRSCYQNFDCEYYRYKKILSCFECVLKRPIGEWTERERKTVEGCLKRAISVLYRPQTTLPRKKRLMMLEKVKFSIRADFKTCEPQSFFYKCNTAIYDTFVSLLYKLRYGILRRVWDRYVLLSKQRNKSSDKTKKIIAISFADKKYAKALWWNLFSAKWVGRCDEIRAYTPDDISEEYKIKHNRIFSYSRGAGLWLWKPYVILDALNKANEGEIIVYTDAGTIFLKDVRHLIECMNAHNTDIMVFENSTIERFFTKKETFVLMNVSESYGNENQILSGYILIRNNKNTKTFIRDWQKYMEDERILSPKHFCEDIREFDGFYHHREDQSVLSLSARKWGIRAFKDPSQYGVRPWEYSGKLWKIRYKNYPNSPYGKVLLTVRKSHPLVMLAKEFRKTILYKIGILSEKKHLKKYKIPQSNILKNGDWT